MVIFRRLLGDVLRSARMQRGMTLRELSGEARVSLGYISEIERGQKEASSELLASLCEAMDLPLSDVLRDVADAVAIEELALGDVATTGVAGPDSQEGRPVGTVWVAAAGPDVVRGRLLALEGDRRTIREAACASAVTLLWDLLREEPGLR